MSYFEKKICGRSLRQGDGSFVLPLQYRNKVGIEETKEVLKNYLTRPDRNLIQLRRYADALGSEKILSTYLEVLL